MHFFDEKFIPTWQLKEQLQQCIDKRDAAKDKDNVPLEILYNERIEQIEKELEFRGKGV